MKRVFLFFTVAALSVSFSSCDFEKECEKNNTGDVRVTNNTEATLWFDVAETNSLDENENRKLVSGASTTYSVTPGRYTIWASFENENEQFIRIEEDISVSQCETYDYFTYNEVCETMNTFDLEVINDYDEVLFVDFWIQTGDDIEEGYYLGEVELPAWGEYTYTHVPVDYTIWAWAAFDGGEWYESPNSFSPTTTCGLFTFRWAPEESKFLVKKEKHNPTKGRRPLK